METEIQIELESRMRQLREQLALETDAAKRFQLSLQMFAIEERLARLGS
jgi:hypothetical protein